MTPTDLRHTLRTNPPESDLSHLARQALLQSGEPLVPAVEILSAEWEKSGAVVVIGEPEEWEEILSLYSVSPTPIPGWPGFEGYSRLFRMEWGKSVDYFIVAEEIF